MADLADAGFLEQPHTSSVRVPITEAYRYYVEQLTGKAHMSQEDESIVHESLHGSSDVQEFMKRTSHVLSLIYRKLCVEASMLSTKNNVGQQYCCSLDYQTVSAVA